MADVFAATVTDPLEQLPAPAQHFDPTSPLDPTEVEARANLVVDVIISALRV
ncbi:hypothetical protein OM076_39495 [Solirubrobacter ginsenosidimutans]|uniref:Uncharacterized protein n=1 Tax=Solirubrobacter ginsenosidimutans TaxID=490573 RepID=A0A9X3N0H9_9ACTN|nr:hypothetical protein [Solirubrobacter ginsenosidimutans]MDA0166416.1 hypothetical protein [Solirubrobacter ginsenosidimutans]